MEFSKIVSHSGTTHWINPRPAYTTRPLLDRTQTLCEFHIHNEVDAQPDGRECDFCKAAMATYEMRYGR